MACISGRIFTWCLPFINLSLAQKTRPTACLVTRIPFPRCVLTALIPSWLYLAWQPWQELAMPCFGESEVKVFSGYDNKWPKFRVGNWFNDEASSCLLTLTGTCKARHSPWCFISKGKSPRIQNLIIIKQLDGLDCFYWPAWIFPHSWTQAWVKPPPCSFVHSA